MGRAMSEADVHSQAAQMISVVIGMIMEDHAEAAVSTLPTDREKRHQHFERLGQAGRDIVALATAADVLMRLSSDACS
jgi:hypothetical protein